MGELHAGRRELVAPCQKPAQSGQDDLAELDLMPVRVSAHADMVEDVSDISSFSIFDG
jgi:hypothetical protein